MRTAQPELRPPAVAAVLMLSAVAVVAVHAAAPVPLRARALTSDVAMIFATSLSGWIILRGASVRSAWVGARFLGFGMVGLAVLNLGFFLRDLTVRPAYQPSPADLAFLGVAALFLLPIREGFAAHFPREDRREIGGDVALTTAALACVTFLFLAPSDGGAATTVSSAIFALIGVAGVTTYGALAMWAPSPQHLGQFTVICAFSVSALAFGRDWVRGEHVAGDAAVALPIAVGGLVLAGLVTLLPGRPARGGATAPPTWGRPLLTTTAVVAASAALALVASRQIDGGFSPFQGRTLIALLACAVAVRILVNQIRSTEATDRARRALEDKEIALAEADMAMTRLREANETLRHSEEHLRLVFDAAVDGIIELDERDAVIRANEAFCRMVRLPREMVEGQPWSALAAVVDGSDEAFVSLPRTGQGTLRREGQALYLESRISAIPGTPPRRLLLVRDVTAARVADQTIRSLFKFLQDRDEDRTRIMRRTNAAIEGERNRIARDLHDGPVQGVSAASLSLEAALLMIKAGEIEEGLDVLNKVRQELSEEADSLRRLMSGLRPPLLEERGLIPAIRETLARFGRDQDMETEFAGGAVASLPTDLETLAYRIVQEALSNAGKHSKATRVSVSVEAEAGQLRIEVGDDGVGFDAAQSREFLRMGRVGLASMRERVELANGTFMVHSIPGKGTTVLATLPMDEAFQRRELAANEV